MSSSYECIEPDVGELLWQMDLPDVDPDLKQQLNDHLSLCADCRLNQALRRILTEQPAGGQLKVVAGGGKARRWWTRGLGLASAASLAGCLLLTFMLPAQDPYDLVTKRAGESPHFTSPVTEEVILGRQPGIAWTEVEGASSYTLIVRESGGEFEWTIESREPSAAVPADVELPADARLQAFLEITPPYLTPDDGISVTFHTGSTAAFAAYRIGANPTWVWLLGVAGLGLLIAVLVRRAADRREGSPV